MTPEEKFQLIKRNTEEIITEKELKELLKKKKKPVVYMGTAITGKPHIAYFLPVLKMADFLKAGFKVKLLLADVHGALDGTPWELLEKRYKYYAKVMPLMFKAIGADIKNFEIIKGSSFQKKQDYQFDILKMSKEASINDCKRAAAEVVKFGDNPKLCGLIYPIMQALDEEYLKVDIQYGGTDQRKIFMFARETLPKIGYKRRIEIMNPMIPGLMGKKMSASDEKSKIDLADDEKTVKDKIKSAYCEPGVIQDNGILEFTKYVIMTIKTDKKEKLIIKRPEKFGGNIEFEKYSEIEKAYKSKKLHPLDLKNTVAEEINKLLEIFRKEKLEIKKLAKQAYTKS
ncbi:tyrosine--tRNA ligase [Candidatus Woesearchaeota archaeon]|nr:tyrosine--tRNA ligase [Candidatus Woesearchaeota archaeon]MBW2978678.1 tyrosine--tRNA ligase [Candidatus Woesearchaeota archaeon]